MPKKIKKLTAEQTAKMPGWRDKWIEIGLRTGQANRELFETSVRACYRHSNLPEPKQIIWVSSPIVLALAAPIAAWLIDRGVSVRDAACSAIRGRARDAVGVAVSDAVQGAVHVAVSGLVGGAVDNAVHSLVSDAVQGAVGGAVHRAVGNAVHSLVTGAAHDAVYDVVDDAVYGAVGEAVGDAVGDAVHRAVGNAAHDAVDAEVRISVNDVVGGAVDDAVHRAVGNAVDDAVVGAVSDAVRGAVGVAVRGSVGGAVDNAISVAVRGEVGNAVGGAVDDAIRGTVDDVIRHAVYNAVHAAVGVDDAVYGAVGEAVNVAVHSLVTGAVHGAVGGAVDTEVRISVNDVVGGAVDDAIRGTVDDVIRHAVYGAVHAAVYDAVHAAVGGDGSVGKLKKYILENWTKYIGGQFWSGGWWGSPSYVSFLRDVCDLDMDAEMRDRSIALSGTAESAGWWWPGRTFVMVCERPTAIRLDAPTDLRRPWTWRMHSDSRLAIEWPDGWGVASWHGIVVPKEWILDKASLEPRVALTEQNTERRRAAAEIIGWARILEEVGSEILDEDPDPEIGTLLSVDLPDAADSRFLRVRCGTGRTFVLPVPTECKTALEANAWTFGLEPVDLKQLEVRT